MYFITATYKRNPFEPAFSAGYLSEWIGEARTTRIAERMANTACERLAKNGRKEVTIRVFNSHDVVIYKVSRW